MSDEQRMEFFRNAQCKDLSEEALAQTVTGLLKESRIAHVLGCAQTARELAELWGADSTDAWRAGMLHDVTKALDESSQLKLCQSYGLQLDDFFRSNPKILHQLTGAAVAAHVFGENQAVCEAIRTHTTGCAGMNTLQKIIYIADYIEPNRDFEGVEQLRTLARTNLNLAMQKGLEMTIAMLTRQERPICLDSVAALEEMKEENKNVKCKTCSL